MATGTRREISIAHLSQLQPGRQEGAGGELAEVVDLKEQLKRLKKTKADETVI